MKAVYTVDDLRSRVLLDQGAEKPARLAVIGWPVAHSASPQMHQPALDADGIDARYIRVEVPEDRLTEAFDRMRALDFIGCNVTVPHKFGALAYCDELDPAARILGTVNTIRFDAEASRGYNTDAPGFSNAIEEAFGRPLASMTVAIAGAAGGAGQAIATQCLMVGVPQLVLINRSQAKLAELVDRLKAAGTTTRLTSLAFDSPDLQDRCLAADLLVNTSSLGLKPGDPSILPRSCLRPGHLVYDTIYQPAVTPLLAQAQACGSKTANGLSMLIHQGALAYQHWFPGHSPLAIMRRALA